ncbi:Methyltransferase type 12 [Delftia sp. Cs1-4]|uniref:tetratricopeptide repeat protein n=1 Tax=Delftia sp. (strain Cs1-4) TaxID=742013 RepID=UPI00020E7DD2|nr:tetratricopeptide repeat protein [Delftia sp. Cs1-4]AEF88261.1 Methyltransferase type 12 [Delftia sp. Cs1-4]
MSTSHNDPNLSLLARARTLINKDELQEAALVLNQARAQAPNDPRVFMMAGLMAEKAGNITGAFQLMLRGTQMDPKWAPGFVELAQLNARQGQFTEAKEAAEQAAKLAPQDFQVLGDLVQTAYLVHDLALAARYLRRMLALQPDRTNLQRQLANCLSKQGQHAEALELWNTTIARNPRDTEALLGRTRTSLAIGQLKQAIADTAALLELEPESRIYEYYAARARGQTPAQQPIELNQEIFDGAAKEFDHLLVNALKYQLPKQVASRLLAAHPDKKFNLLDLGCGTGLLGASLGRIAGQLDGIDISQKMIEQAQRLKLYNHLQTIDLDSALKAASETFYNAITALDVLVYAGDPSSVIFNSERLLAPAGQLILSCEAAPEEGPDLVLNAVTERYAHKLSHVEKLCRAANFETVETEHTTLRYEKGEPVKGFVIYARKRS